MSLLSCPPAAENLSVINFLQFIMTNDLSLLKAGKSQYSVMCYENGTVVDDTIYYMENDKKFRIIVNAGNINKDYHWINDHKGNYKVNIYDVSKDRCRLALQGPNSDTLLKPLVDIELSALKRFDFTIINLDNIPIFIARTGYSGEKGFEISFESQFAEKVYPANL